MIPFKEIKSIVFSLNKSTLRHVLGKQRLRLSKDEITLYIHSIFGYLQNLVGSSNRRFTIELATKKDELSLALQSAMPNWLGLLLRHGSYLPLWLRCPLIT